MAVESEEYLIFGLAPNSEIVEVEGVEDIESLIPADTFVLAVPSRASADRIREAVGELLDRAIAEANSDSWPDVVGEMG